MIDAACAFPHACSASPNARDAPAARFSGGRAAAGSIGLLTYHEEASTESGAWLFARVTFDGTLISFDRAFDSWPEWYRVVNPSEGPGLEDLAWEMGQRAEQWRPTWSRLLPA